MPKAKKANKAIHWELTSFGWTKIGSPVPYPLHPMVHPEAVQRS